MPQSMSPSGCEPKVSCTIEGFRRAVWENYRVRGRHALPWRQNVGGAHFPWSVLVSECMLQQTQIERVVPYHEQWMKKWPTPAALAAASLDEVLRAWSGLGYNRRGRALHVAAREIVERFGGEVPREKSALESLPGIGPYTAGAVSCFAFNMPCVFIETNIRAAAIHFFFAENASAAGEKIPDSDLFPLLEKSLVRAKPREWNWALMDYGAEIKRRFPNPGRRSLHYTTQSRFEGSFRQKRAALLKILVNAGPSRAEKLSEKSGIQGDVLYRALESLVKDLMVCEKNGVYSVGA